MAVHKRTLVHQIARENGLSDNKTYEVIQSFLEKLIDTIVTEKRIELRGFGVFHLSTKKGRMIEHPVTHQIYQLPDIQAVAFRAAQQVKAKINPRPEPPPAPGSRFVRL